MKIKKGIILFLAVVLTLGSVLTGCGGGETASNSDETYNLVWYERATPTRDVDMVFSEVSKLTLEKINANVQCIPIIYAEYAEKINMLIASGEKMDVMTTINYSTNAAGGSYYPLSELLETNGKEVKDMLPQYAWDAVTINNEIYAVPSLKDWPTHWVLWYYKKYEDKYGFDMQKVTSLPELEPILQTIKDNEPDIVPLATTGNTSLQCFLPFESISGCSVLAFEMGDYSKIVNKYETEEYKEFYELMRSWNQKGFFSPDAATRKNSQDLIKAHKVFADYGATIPFFEDSRNIGVPEELHTKFAYNLDTPKTNTASILGSVMSIYSKSENPAKAMDFIKLLFTDKEVANMIVYGLEGKHYNAVGENKYSYPEGVKGNSNDDYYFPASTHGNRFLLRIHESEPNDKWEQMQEFNDSAEISPAMGFSFDTTSVMNEITAINNVTSEYCPSLNVGAVDPAEYQAKLIAELKTAGIDRVVDEAQRQYDEWKKNK